MQPPLHSLWKQFLSALGQRARQPAYLGAHRELLNCSRTFLGPQRRFRMRSDAMPCSVLLVSRCGAENDKGVARLAIAFFAAPESCRRSILVAAGAEPSRGPLSTRRARTAEAANAGRRRREGSPDERLLPSMRAIE